MDLEMEVPETSPLLDRLTAAAAALESAAGRLATLELNASQSRESELEQKLAAAQQTIAQLQAAAPRKTAGLIAREGVTLEAGALAGVLDAALISLSLEQRIAVKSQLLRAGLLG